MIQFDYVENARDSRPKACSRERFEQLLDREDVARVCSQIAGLEAQMDIAATITDEEERRHTLARLTDEVGALKRRLPAFTFFATFQGQSRRAEHARASGLAYLDLDHVGDARALWASTEMSVPQELLAEIALVHVTPSGRGLRIVFLVRPEDGSIEAAQARMAAELGIREYDGVCKDLSRLSFCVPRSYVLLMNWDLQPASASANADAADVPNRKVAVPAGTAEVPNGTAVVPADTAETLNNTTAVPAGTAATPAGPSDSGTTAEGVENLGYRGVSYAQIISDFWRHTGGEPVEGERNVRLHQLAVNLRAICDNRRELLMRVMPRLGLSETELQTIVDSACKEPPKGISRQMQAIIAEELRLQDAAWDADGDGTTEAEGCDSTPTDAGLALSVKKLPVGLRESLVGVPETMQMPVLCAVLPIAAAYADGVEVEYCDGQRQRLGLMSIIHGEQASGKSVCKAAVDVWKRQLDEEDVVARRREDEWRERRKGRKANEKAPEDPHVLIRVVPVTVSCSTLLRRFKNAAGHTLYSFGEELDTLRKTNGAGSWSSKYDIYRLGFDNGEWGQDYNSDQAESGVVRVAYNWTMLGTSGALHKCFRQDNIENGLSSRILVAEMPDSAFARMPKFGRRTPEDEARIQEAVTRLRSRSGFIDTPRLRQAMETWVEQKRVEAAKDIDRVKDTYRKRAAVIGFRCGVIFLLLTQENEKLKVKSEKLNEEDERGSEKLKVKSEKLKVKSEKCRESKAAIDFALMMAEYTLEQQIRAFGQALQKEYMEARDESQRYGVNRSIFDQLPPSFTVADLTALKPSSLSRNSIIKIISRWHLDGWIEREDMTHWRKVRPDRDSDTVTS